MTGEELYKLIGEIDEKYIEEAETYKKLSSGRRVWVRWGAAAACICLIAAGALTLPLMHVGTDGSPEIAISPRSAPLDNTSAADMDTSGTTSSPYTTGDAAMDEEAMLHDLESVRSTESISAENAIDGTETYTYEDVTLKAPPVELKEDEAAEEKFLETDPAVDRTEVTVEVRVNELLAESESEEPVELPASAEVVEMPAEIPSEASAGVGVVYTLTEAEYMYVELVALQSEGFRCTVVDVGSNTVFPQYAELWVSFEEAETIVQSDATLFVYNAAEPNAEESAFEAGDVFLVEFHQYLDYEPGNHFYNMAYADNVYGITAYTLEPEE